MDGCGARTEGDERREARLIVALLAGESPRIAAALGVPCVAGVAGVGSNIAGDAPRDSAVAGLIGVVAREWM